MKPECAECEATLKLALERVKRLEAALRAVAERAARRDACWCDDCLREIALSTLTALRPEGT